MYAIGLLIALACAGLIAGPWLMLGKRKRGVAGLIQRIEARAGLDTEVAAPGKAQGSPAALLLRSLHRFLPERLLEGYGRLLLWAGRPLGLDAQQFAGLKVALGILLPVTVAVALIPRMNPSLFLLTILLGIMGFAGPDVWLKAKVRARQDTVSDELPLFTDLVATAIEAGLSLTEAVRRVAADAPGLVAQEFLRTIQEMAVGLPRKEAWRNLMARLPGDDLRTIVTAIMQAEQYGTSVAEILRYQVQQIRLFKQSEAQRVAQATTVKMRIPMLALEAQPGGEAA